MEESDPDESVEESSAPDIIELPEDPVDTVLSFVACGNNLIHPSVYYAGMEYYAAANGTKVDYKTWPTNDMGYDFLPIYEYVADTMKNADICFINQETLSGGPGTKIDGYPQFNTPSRWREIWQRWAWTSSTWPTTICWIPATINC